MDLSAVELERLRAGVFDRAQRDVELYRAYYQSRSWRARRQRVLRERPCCERCQRARAQMAHHLSYKRIGQELDSDLMAVCRSCHHQLHGRRF